MQYQEGQRLQGSDGKIYVVSGGVPREALSAPQAPAQAPGAIVVGTPRPKQPELRQVGDSLGLVDPQTGNFTPTYTAPPKVESPKPPKGGNPVDNARNLLQAAGVDLATGKDPVSDLIRGSTSGRIEHLGAEAYGAITGDATSGMENIGKLRTIASDLTLQLTGGSLGSQISNTDREFIVQRVGDIGNPDVPANQRLAAWEQVKQRMANILGVPAMNGAPAGPGKRLSPEDEQKLIALVKSGATPQQIDDFLMPLGFSSSNAGREPTSPGIDYSAADARAQQQIDDRMAEHGGAGAAGVMGAVDTATFGFGDEITAGGNAFIQSLSGKGSIGDLYDRNIGIERGYREHLQKEHPYAYGAGQFIGGAAIPIGAGVSSVRGLATLGAAQGGAYGFGSSEGNPLQRLPGAVIGAGTGGAFGAALGVAAPYVENALIRYAPNAAKRAEMDAARPVIEAGGRQGIPIRQPDVRPGLRGDLAAVEKSPSAGPQVGNTLRADREAMEARVGDLGTATGGEAKDPYALGNDLHGTANRHKERTSNEATVLFERAKRLARDHRVENPPQTFAAIDERIAELTANGETANAAEIKVLRGIKSDLQKSGLTIDSLQTQKRAMRQRLADNGIDPSSGDAAYMQILQVAGSELEASLTHNPRALGALQTANKQWAERSAFRKEVARQFVGTRNNPVAPEVAASRFLSMAKSKGDYNRFSRMFNEMDGTERANVAASIADGLGRGRDGEFSYGRFVSDLENMNPRALRDLFGKDGFAALQDLKAIAAAKRDAAAGLNHSNTGSVLSRQNSFKDALLALFGGGVAGLPGAIGGFVARGALEKFTSKRAARMLLNPDFTKWLRQTPNTTSPEVINWHFARLTSIASKNPVLAGDAKALQQVLTDAFSESAPRAAAGQEKDD